MSWKYFLGILVVGLLVFSCAPSSQYSVSTFDKNNPDFSFLKTALAGKKVVALGESSHGFGDVQSLKTKMVKYLHEEMGYDVLMLESGYGDVNCSWDAIDKLRAQELMKGSVFGNFMSKQMFPLFEYLKATSVTDSKLDFAGFDSQLSAKGFQYRLLDLVNQLEPRVIQDSIITGFASYYTMFQQRDNRTEWKFHKDRLFASIDLAKSVLDDNIEEIREKEMATVSQLKILNNTLNGLKVSVDYPFGETLTTGFRLRDSIMAHNVITQMAEEYPNRKVIIWGHNGHVEKGHDRKDHSKWMGHFLKEEFGDKYYVMGIFALRGQVYTQWNYGVEDFNLNDTMFMEYKMTDKQTEDVFADLPKFENNGEWYNRNIKGYELESGGIVQFTPSKRFDGIITIRETGPSIFE